MDGERLLFVSPHPKREGLTTSSQLLAHKLHFISQSPCRKRREKKIHLLNVVLGMEHFLRLYMGAIPRYGFSAETL